MQFEVMERYMTLAQSLALALALALALEEVMNRYLALVKPCVGAVHPVECQSPLLS